LGRGRLENPDSLWHPGVRGGGGPSARESKAVIEKLGNTAQSRSEKDLLSSGVIRLT